MTGVTEEPDGPGAHVFIRVPQQLAGKFFGEAARDIQRPKRLQCQPRILLVGDLVAKPTPFGTATGERPSPGAAGSDSPGGWSDSDATCFADIAAPEDGRSPTLVRSFGSLGLERFAVRLCTR